MRVIAVMGAIVVLAAPVLAVEVILADGEVLVAESYEVVGGYVMIELPEGGQMAFAVEDVDLEATRAAQGLEEQPTVQEETARQPTSLADVAAAIRKETASTPSSGLSITDADVGHVNTSAVASADAAGGEPEQPPPGTQSGGNVEAVRLTLREVRQGEYVFSGGVQNRNDFAIRNVFLRVGLSTVGGEDLGEQRVPVTDLLEPGGAAPFEVNLRSESRPRYSVQVFWMQEEQPASGGASGASGNAPVIPPDRLPAGGGA